MEGVSNERGEDWMGAAIAGVNDGTGEQLNG